ncbi:MAG: hypothetical protein ACI8R4_001733 [Paracoccaceae bacterium]|jgi:hypothetical protein
MRVLGLGDLVSTRPRVGLRRHAPSVGPRTGVLGIRLPDLSLNRAGRLCPLGFLSACFSRTNSRCYSRIDAYDGPCGCRLTQHRVNLLEKGPVFGLVTPQNARVGPGRRAKQVPCDLPSYYLLRCLSV